MTKAAKQFIHLSKIIHIWKEKREEYFQSSLQIEKSIHFILQAVFLFISSSEAAAVIRNRGANAGFFAEYILILKNRNA